MFALLAEDAKGQPRRSRKSVQEFDEQLKEAQTKRISIGGINVLNVEASPDGTKWIETSQADVCVGAVIALNCIVPSSSVLCFVSVASTEMSRVIICVV